MSVRIAIAAGIVACLAGGPALAQLEAAPKGATPKGATPAKPAAKPKPKVAAPAKAAPAPPQVATPDAQKIVLLLRNTLVTLNDALQTGNFTVLRDRAAPGFQAANSAAKLGQIFADLSARNVDLSTVSIATPQLSENPVLDPNTGMLRLKGFFPLQPQPIAFEVLYQSVGGRWRLFGLAVQPANAVPQQAQAPTGMPAPPLPPN